MEISKASFQPGIKVANRNFLLFAVTALFVALITIKYVQSEHFFYYWDFGGFHGVSNDVTRAFVHSFKIGDIYHSPIH
jgi:hypothetical protein